MPRGEKFGPVRPFGSFPRLNPKPFDPRESVFIPDLGVDDSKIRSVSPRKMRLIGAKVYNSATQSIAGGLGSGTFITYDTEAFDQGNLYASAFTDRLTIPYTGIWMCVSFATFAQNATGQRTSRLRVNGSTTVQQATALGFANLGNPLLCSTTLLLKAGDYISQDVEQNSGGALNVQAGEDDNFLSAIFLGAI